VWSLTGALVVAVAVAALPRGASADDDDAKVSETRCPLGKGNKPGKIITTTEAQACGSGGCTQIQTEELLDGAGKTLIAWSDDIGGDFEPPSSLSFACKGGAVVISDDKGDLLTLSYEVAAHKLRLPPSIHKQIEDAWRAPPARGAAVADRDRLSLALGSLSPPGPNTVVAYEGAPFEVLGLDLELGHSAALLAARDRVEAGAWETAELTINSILSARPPPTATVARRCAALVDRLAALRRQSAPVTVADSHRIGTVPTAPPTPVTSDGPPTIFWRGDSLCVAQEDHKPPTEMRCLDPRTRKWAAREPLQRPRSSGEHLRSTSYPNVTRCEGTWIVQTSVPENDEETACGGGPGENDEELVGVVDGDAMLLANGGGFRLNRAPTKTETLTTKRANALVATTAGSLVLGNGCCRFLADGRVARLAKDSDEQRWPILGPPPKDQRWSQAPLASPSQAWAVAFSQNKTTSQGAVTLWLVRLTTPGR
jgi:hypothetical protein